MTTKSPTGGEPSAVTAAPAEHRQRPRRSEFLEALSGRYRMVPILFVLVVIWVIFWSQEPAFLSSRNLSNLLVQTVVTGILALGLTFILLLGEIDLSVAATSGACAALSGLLVTQFHWSVVPAVVLAIGMGGGIGAIQGGIITSFGAPAFLVTLGGSLALQGLLLWILPSGVGQIPLLGTPFDVLGSLFLPSWLGWGLGILGIVGFSLVRLRTFQGRRQHGFTTNPLRDVLTPAACVAVVVLIALSVLNDYRGLPASVAIFLIFVIVAAYIMASTRFGLYIYAIGANAEAARRAGIQVGNLRIAAFIIAGVLAAIAGVFAESRVLGVTVDSGGGTLLLEAIAAAVIGGTSLFGGRGTVWAALIGALVIGSISNGMDLLGVGTEVKFVVEGSILVLATVLDAIITRGSILGRK